jgi:hypothetical protein
MAELIGVRVQSACVAAVPKSPTNTKKNPVFYHVYMEELEAYLIK